MIVASNNITLSNVNDGSTPYFHTAYANSADGKDGFYVSGGTNLFSQSTATSGYVDGVTGNVDPTSSSNEIVSDYIPVSASSNYTFQMWGTTPSGNTSWYGIGLYDSNKNFISRPAEYGVKQTSDTVEHISTTLTTTATTAFVRVSFSKYNDYKAKFEQGSVATPWCPAPSEMNPTYMGTYTDYTQEASLDPTAYQWSLIKGADGTPGKDGLGIRSTIITYQLSSSGTTTPTGTWSTTVPTLVKGQYLWTRNTLVYTDNTTNDVYTVSYVAKDGNDGTNGVAGKDGVGIKSTTITYQESTSGTTAPTGIWATNPPTVDDGNYLWTRTVWTYTDGTSETGYSVAKAGEKGSDGTDGKSVWYYPYDRGASRAGNWWSDLQPAPTMANPPKVGDTIIDLVGNMYQITNVVVDASISGGGTFDYGPTLTSIKGAQGIQGAPGKNGQTTYFHIAYSNSADGSGCTTTPDINSSYKYIGTYTDYTSTSSTNPSSYTWVPMFDSSKKRNFTTTPTTPYDVGDTWTTSGSTYFCKTARSDGAFNQSDWTLQQLTIQSLDSNLQANINGDKNLLMVDDVTYYSNPALDSTNTYNEGYPFDYTSTDNTYTFQVQAKSTVSGDYVHMYPAWGNKYSQSQDKTIKVDVTTSPSVPNQTTTFNSVDSNTQLLLTTDWVTYTCTVSGTWDKGSVLTALLGRVFNSETKGTVSFRKVKLVAGNAIKDYTSDDSITVAQGSNYWDLTTLQNNSGVGTNLFSQSTATSGYVDGVTGNVDPTSSSNEIVSDYIPVSASSNYTFQMWGTTPSGNTSWYGIGLYDSNKNFISRPAEYGVKQTSDTVEHISTTLTTTATTAFVRVSFSKYNDYKAKFEKGSIATDWSPAPSENDYASWLQNRYYTPWYPISEGQRVFLTHYDYPNHSGIPSSASVEFADSNHNFISNGTKNSQGSSTLDGSNSSFISPQSLGGVYYNERMLKISIASEAFTSGTYQDLYIKTSGLLQSKLAVSGRGTTVATFDPYSGKRVDTQYWDTFASVDNANALVNYLNSIANQDLVVAIATQDSFIQDSNDFQIASQNLCTVLQSMGLPSSYAPADLRGRVSFAFVGHTTAYRGTTDKALVNSSKGDNQVSTLTAYVSNGHISSANNTGLVAYANAPAKTAYFRAGYSFSTDEINRVHFMVTVDKLSTNYSSSIADVSSNAVRKDVSYRGVTLNDNGLTATAGNTQVIVNSSNGFEIKKKDDQTNTLSNVFSVDTDGNVYITGSTISKGNISGVDFSGDNLTLAGTLNINGSDTYNASAGYIVGPDKTYTIGPKGMVFSPKNGDDNATITISDGGLTIQGSSVGSQSTAGTYGSNDSLAGDAGLFATKDKAGNTKTWITSSGTLIAQDAVIHGNVSVDNLTLTGTGSKIMFGSGFQIDGNGAMTSTSKNAQISNGTYSDGVIEGSELDIGTAYHSMLSNADKYRYHVSNIGETTFGMAQDIFLMGTTPDVNKSYLSLDNYWTQGQVNFRGTGKAPNNASQVAQMTGDIYFDIYGWKHRFSAPVNGVSDTRNYIPIWDKDNSGTMPSYNINYKITDSFTNILTSIQKPSWGGNGLPNWTLGTVEFPDLAESLFTFSDKSTLYPDHDQTIKLSAGVPYVFGAYIWHCGLRNGAKVTIMTSSSPTSLQDTHYYLGNIVGYQQSGYSLVSYTPSSDVYLHSVYVEVGVAGGNQGDNYGVPLSVTDPFAIDLHKFTSKLFGGGLDTLTSLGGHFGMPYPHLDKSQHGVLGLMATDHLNDGDIIIVSLPINYVNKQTTNFPQINLGIAKPGNDDVYIPIDGEFQPLMPGYYTYDFYFVWKDEYKNYINSNMVQLNLISNGIDYYEKAYVVSVDSVRMGIFTGSPTTSSSYFVNEYQTKFTPLGSLQLSHLNTTEVVGGSSGYAVAGQTQLTSEGLTISSSFSHMEDINNITYTGMHVAINGKTGISVGGTTNNDPNNQPTLSIYGSAPYDNLLESTIEPTYTISNDGSTTACGIWFDSYGNLHGYDSSQNWNVRSPSWKTQLTVPIHDGNGYNISLTDKNGNPGDNSLSIGLIHFNKFGGGYVGGNYPAIYSGSGDQLAGIAFGAGYVIIFGNRNTTNNFWSFPQGGGDGHSSDSGTVSLVTN